MRLIHSVIEDMQADPDDHVSPLRSALEALLGGERGTLPQLRQRFHDTGYGGVMESWIGDDANLPIDPDVLGRILGRERAGTLATLSGLSTADFLVHLARVLPHAVHRMTPEGDLGPDDPLQGATRQEMP
ncbi:MAG: YidB family protein [Acetobacteraceae bacterium]